MLRQLQGQIQSPSEPPPERPKVKLFAGLRQNKGYVLKASLLVLLFWFLQFFYQFYFIDDDIGLAILRASAFSGATLISVALIIGPLARLTNYNFIFHRRTVGVWGFTFTIMHVFTVLLVLFNFNFASVWLLGTNPFVNPVIFGIMAFWLFVPLYLTSTDWALNRLGFRWWKTTHRLIYFAYIFAILHYTLVNPSMLYSVAGYLLVFVTLLALTLQTTAFVKTVKKTRSKKATIIGLLIILFGIILFYIAFS